MPIFGGFSSLLTPGRLEQSGTINMLSTMPNYNFMVKRLIANHDAEAKLSYIESLSMKPLFAAPESPAVKYNTVLESSNRGK